MPPSSRFVSCCWEESAGRGGRVESRVLPAGVIGLVCAGYYGIYLTTPHDLEWHLATSLDRLIVQLWPMVVFTTFLQLRSPGRSPGRGDFVRQSDRGLPAGGDSSRTPRGLKHRPVCRATIAIA